MIKCGNCGRPNEDGAVFCTACNHFLEWSASKPETPETSEPPPPAPPPPPPPPPVPSSPPEPPPPRPEPVPTVAPVSVEGLIAAIDEGRSLAGQRDRADLTAQLDTARRRLESRTITTVVVGEFKRGKSTLVNALLQTAVCPVDADIVTAVPTMVRYGDQPGLTLYRQVEPDQEPVGEPAPLARITEFVSETASPDRGRLQSVTVQVPHRMLDSGLCLLDTPGVGGLDSVHGQLTLASLDRADAVVFVTDAAQELTAPELDFLRTAMKRCPSGALVVTKTDLYPHWRQIVELDTGHLSRAGLDLPVIPVSSFLRLRAVQQPDLNQESGFAPLVQFLATAVVVPGTTRAAADVAYDVNFVATQLAQQSDAERVVLAEPEKSPEVLSNLTEARRKAANLAAGSATWQQTLGDGIADLVADIEHDLQSRLRTVLRDVETIIDQGDPRETWADTEVWLRRQVAIAGVANRDLLVSRARELSEQVAETFDLEAGTGVDLDLAELNTALDTLELASTESLSMPGGRLGSLMVAARSAVFVPMVLFGIGSVLLPVVAVAGVAATLGAGIGGKLIKDERKRQRLYRQQQAKAATRRYVDEVAFVMNKETRDSLRKAQRQLRDDFQYRATLMHQSSSSALEAAARAAQLTPEERAARAGQLAAEAERLRSIRSSTREFAVTAGRAVAGTAAGAGAAMLGEHAVRAAAAPGPADDQPEGDDD